MPIKKVGKQWVAECDFCGAKDVSPYPSFKQSDRYFFERYWTTSERHSIAKCKECNKFRPVDINDDREFVCVECGYRGIFGNWEDGHSPWSGRCKRCGRVYNPHNIMDGLPSTNYLRQNTYAPMKTEFDGKPFAVESVGESKPYYVRVKHRSNIGMVDKSKIVDRDGYVVLKDNPQMVDRFYMGRDRTAKRVGRKHSIIDKGTVDGISEYTDIYYDPSYDRDHKVISNVRYTQDPSKIKNLSVKGRFFKSRR